MFAYVRTTSHCTILLICSCILFTLLLCIHYRIMEYCVYIVVITINLFHYTRTIVFYNILYIVVYYSFVCYYTGIIIFYIVIGVLNSCIPFICLHICAQHHTYDIIGIWWHTIHLFAVKTRTTIFY